MDLSDTNLNTRIQGRPLMYFDEDKLLGLKILRIPDGIRIPDEFMESLHIYEGNFNNSIFLLYGQIILMIIQMVKRFLILELVWNFQQKLWNCWLV